MSKQKPEKFTVTVTPDKTRPAKPLVELTQAQLEATEIRIKPETQITLPQFWRLADDTRLKTEYLAEQKLQYLPRAPLGILQQICLQYRYFVRDYPNNLAILISKTPYGEFKSLMAQILADELGNGDFKGTHLKLWDEFLIGIGLSPEVLDNSIHPDNLKLLAELRQLTLNKPVAYVIGLCGMGGECLCQVYLTAMYEYMTLNPYIQSNKENIDWKFWQIHIGEEDIRHRLRVREAINQIINVKPSSLPDLAAGYQKAKSNWDTFWENSYKLAMSQPKGN